MNRRRSDRCPGVLRPWPADDGLLVRVRIPGGQVRAAPLLALARVAARHGDGRVGLTSRANLQVRGFRASAAEPTQLGAAALEDLEATGLLPQRSHDLVRNIMASPQTGLAGGRADLRPVVRELDRALRASPRLGGLPGRFLFVLDDGRGDVLGRTCDLGLVALDADTAQLRVGTAFGPVVPLVEAPALLANLAEHFLRQRGTGPTAPWHVRELPTPLVPDRPPAPQVPEVRGPLGWGPVPGGHHHPAPGRGLDRAELTRLLGTSTHLVVTPWRGLLIPEENA